jgi:hypothetical protein
LIVFKLELQLQIAQLNAAKEKAEARAQIAEMQVKNGPDGGQTGQLPKEGVKWNGMKRREKM